MDYCYIKLLYDDSEDLSLNDLAEFEDASIQNSQQKLEFVQYNDQLLFKLLKGDKFEFLALQLRYYASAVLPKDKKYSRSFKPSSGAYMFVVNTSANHGESVPYG